MNPETTVYLLFSYESYYPSGGFDDLRGIFATLEEAKKAVHKPVGEYEQVPADHGWIYIEQLKGTERGRRWYANKRWHGNAVTHPSTPGRWEITWEEVGYDHF